MKRRIVLGALGLVVLTASVFGVWQRHALLAWYQARQLSAAAPEQRQGFVTRFDRLGDSGTAALVNLFCSDDETTCQNASFVLTKLLAGWGGADPRRVALLDAFTQSVGQFSPCGQTECIGVLQQFLSEQTEPPPALVEVMTRLLAQVGANPSVRQAALELTTDLLRQETGAAESLVTQAKAWAVAGLRDNSPEVRMAAVRLAVVPGLRAFDLLPQLVTGDKPDPSAEVRQLVLLALGEHDALLSTDDVCKMLHDEDAQVRSLAERALRARGLTVGQITLARLVNDPRPASRAEVPALVLQTPELDTVRWMEKLTRDPAPAVRAATARALGMEPKLRLDSLMRQLAERDADPTVQEIARYFLGRTVKEQ